MEEEKADSKSQTSKSEFEKALAEKKIELTYIAKLQQKKNALRKLLKDKGILKKDKKNKFDGYTYLSEASYKELFTELFSETGLELKYDIPEEPEKIDGTDKQPFAYRVKMVFELLDIDTGYSERTNVYADAFDKGDKALYKAYTGALKYYLADTFMVATGDDPETESPDGKKVMAKATPGQIKYIKDAYGEDLDKLTKYYKLAKIEDMDVKTASELISKLKQKRME